MTVGAGGGGGGRWLCRLVLQALLRCTLLLHSLLLRRGIAIQTERSGLRLAVLVLRSSGGYGRISRLLANSLLLFRNLLCGHGLGAIAVTRLTSLLRLRSQRILIRNLRIRIIDRAIAVPGATASPASAVCVEAATPAPAPSAVSCGPGGSVLRGACPKRTFSRLIFFGLAGAAALLLAVAVVVEDGLAAAGVVSDGVAASLPAAAEGAGAEEAAGAAAEGAATAGVAAGVVVVLLTSEKRPPRSKRCFSLLFGHWRSVCAEDRLGLTRTGSGVDETRLDIDVGIFTQFGQVGAQSRLHLLHIHRFLNLGLDVLESRNAGLLVFGNL